MNVTSAKTPPARTFQVPRTSRSTGAWRGSIRKPASPGGTMSGMPAQEEVITGSAWAHGFADHQGGYLLETHTKVQENVRGRHETVARVGRQLERVIDYQYSVTQRSVRRSVARARHAKARDLHTSRPPRHEARARGPARRSSTTDDCRPRSGRQFHRREPPAGR
jgi:hypothetical protein